MSVRTSGARAALVACLALAVSAGFSACGDSSREPGSSTVLDERDGSYDSVAIGDPESKVRRLFGTPRRDRDGECDLCPAGTTVDDEFGVPTVVDSPPGETHALRYKDAVYLTARGRVFGFVVTDRSAETLRRVGIGDPLDRVRKRYRRLRCGVANSGSEYPEHPYCAGKLGRLFISFGEDPIKSITVSSTRLSG